MPLIDFYEELGRAPNEGTRGFYVNTNDITYVDIKTPQDITIHFGGTSHVITPDVKKDELTLHQDNANVLRILKDNKVPLAKIGNHLINVDNVSSFSPTTRDFSKTKITFRNDYGHGLTLNIALDAVKMAIKAAEKTRSR